MRSFFKVFIIVQQLKEEFFLNLFYYCLTAEGGGEAGRQDRRQCQLGSHSNSHPSLQTEMKRKNIKINLPLTFTKYLISFGHLQLSRSSLLL